MKLRNYRLRFALNLGIIALAVLTFALIRLGPSNGKKQSLEHVLRRNLAADAQVLYAIQPPDTQWALGEEALYVLGLRGGAVGILRTMHTRVGNTVMGTQHDQIQLVPFCQGLAIMPLWCTSRAPQGETVYGYCAVAAQSPAVAAVELRYYADGDRSADAPPPIPMEHYDTQNGLWLFRVPLGSSDPHSLNSFSWENTFEIYHRTTQYSFSAKAFDAQGSLVAQTDHPDDRSTEEDAA